MPGAAQTLTVDLGELVQGEMSEHAVVVPLEVEPEHVEQVTSGYACSSAEAPETEEGKLRLNLRCVARQHGALRDELRLVSSHAPRDVVVKLLGHVSPRLAFEPSLVDVNLTHREEATREVRLVGLHADEATLRLVEPTDDCEVTQSAQSLQLRWSGNRAGTRSGRLTFETGVTTPARLTLHYRIRVEGTLSVFPETPYINLRGAGPSRADVRLKSSQPGFRVTAVRVLTGPLTARVRERSPGRAVIEVEVVERRLDSKLRGVVGEVLIESNDITEPKRRLRVLGFGKPAAASGE